MRVTDVGPGSRSARTTVVLVPGLGAPSYVLPTVHALAAAGARTSLLDVPGFGAAGPLSCEPTVTSLAAAVVGHLRRLDPAQRVVLFGHSTAAIVALRAALEVQDAVPLAGVVLAGPVFAPTQRSLPSLALAASTACRREPLRELRVLNDHWRGRRSLPALVRSGLAERPEQLIESLTVPVTLTAGTDDTFAPRWWLLQLAQAASRSVEVQVAQLPGSHNNPFTHPDAVARLVMDCGRGSTPTPVSDGGRAVAPRDPTPTA